MRVSEVMTRGVECIRPEATLTEAAVQMRSLNIGVLPVCQNGDIIGMLTDRDITIRGVADGRDPQTVKVREVMTDRVITCCEDELLTQAVQLMQQHQLRRLVVVDNQKHPVGILTLGDISVEAGDDGIVGSTLDAVCEPNRHRHKDA